MGLREYEGQAQKTTLHKGIDQRTTCICGARLKDMYMRDQIKRLPVYKGLVKGHLCIYEGLVKGLTVNEGLVKGLTVYQGLVKGLPVYSGVVVKELPVYEGLLKGLPVYEGLVKRHQYMRGQ